MCLPDHQHSFSRLKFCLTSSVEILSVDRLTPSSISTGEVVTATGVVGPRNLAKESVKHYQRTIDQWKEFMKWEGRHPVCPNQDHVLRFARYYKDEKGNSPGVVRRKLNRLSQAFEYFRNDSSYPHPSDFSPVSAAMMKVNLSQPSPKEPPRISKEEMAEHISEIKDVRDRAIIMTQLKLGIRAQELCNIKLEDIHIKKPDLLGHYSEMGSNRGLEDHENAIYIPFNKERDGNKSERPRIIPLDEEIRKVLTDWLFIRPDNEEPWLFLSDRKNIQFETSAVRDIWHKHFRPEYDETERHAAVSSHFGRHFFTTWWQVHQGMDIELVKYLRGDVHGGERDMKNSGDAIHSYIHTYYEDVEPEYRRSVF